VLDIRGKTVQLADHRRKLRIRHTRVDVGTSGDIHGYVRNNYFYGQTTSMARPRAMRYRTGQATFMSTDRVAVRLLYDSLAMTACNNYWGTLDEAVIEQIIYDKGWIYSVHPLAGRSRSEYTDSRQPASDVHAEHPCGSNPPFAHRKGRISGVSRRISLPSHSNSMTCLGPTRKPPLPHALGGAPPDDLI